MMKTSVIIIIIEKKMEMLFIWKKKEKLIEDLY